MLDILGKSVNWRTMDGLPIGCIQRATEMVGKPEYDLDILKQAIYILERYRWFTKLKLTTEPPWSKELPWDELQKLHPWKKKERKSTRAGAGGNPPLPGLRE